MSEFVDKAIINKKLEDIMFGIKLKDIDEIIKEISELKKSISDYREPYRCDTCRDYPCSAYRVGCRDCSDWK